MISSSLTAAAPHNDIDGLVFLQNRQWRVGSTYIPEVREAQIKGKVRARIMVPASLTAADGEKLLENETVKKLVGDAPVRKLIFVPGRLLNIVC